MSMLAPLERVGETSEVRLTFQAAQKVAYRPGNAPLTPSCGVGIHLWREGANVPRGQERREEGVERTLMASAGLTRPAVVGSHPQAHRGKKYLEPGNSQARGIHSRTPG